MLLLDIMLVQDGSTLGGWVVTMDNSLRGKGTLATSDDGKFSILSLYVPQLNAIQLYVQGRKRNADGEYFSYAYPSVTKAYSTADHIKECLEQIGDCENVSDGNSWVRHYRVTKRPEKPVPLPRYVLARVDGTVLIIDRETGRTALFFAEAETACARLNAGEEWNCFWCDPLPATQKETNR